MRLQTSSTVLAVVLIASPILAAVTPQPLPCINNFDSYAANTPVTSLTNGGWDASSTNVVIQTAVISPVTPNVGAVLIPELMAVSNAVTSGSGLSNVWFDGEVVMGPDGEKTPPPVNSNAVVLVAPGSNGYLRVYDRNVGEWVSLSHDIALAGVNALTNGQWARVSIHQNYATHQCAVFLDGRALMDRLPFVSNVNQCATFCILGASLASSYLDNYGMTLAVPSGLTNDVNQDGLPDGEELRVHGYLGKTLEVGAGKAFASIQAAMDYALARDVISVTAAGPYGAVTVGHAVGGLTGQVFTVTGNVNVGPGLSVTSQVGFTCTDLSISNGATLVITGTVNAAHLILQSGARVIINGTITADGLTVSGSFTLDEQWNTQARSTLPFADNFEVYQVGVPLNSLGFRGWGASGNGVVVESDQTYGGSARAVGLGFDEVVSNRVSTSSPTNVWTDFCGVLAYGAADATPVVELSAVALVHVSTNGYLTVRNNNAWDICTSDVWQAAVPVITNGQWVHVSVNNNFVSKKTALMLNGQLLRDNIPFVNISADHYSTFRVFNEHTNAAYIDNVLIQQSVPVSLANTDAVCIQLYGVVLKGSVFILR